MPQRYEVQEHEAGGYIIMDRDWNYQAGEYATKEEALMQAMILEQAWRKRQAYYHGPSNVAGPTTREYWELMDLEAQEREDRYYDAQDY